MADKFCKKCHSASIFCAFIGILEIIAGIIVLIIGIGDSEPAFVGFGIGLIVFGIISAWLLSLLFDTLNVILTYVSTVSRNQYTYLTSQKNDIYHVNF